jgi:hypothetical protein
MLEDRGYAWLGLAKVSFIGGSARWLLTLKAPCALRQVCIAAIILLFYYFDTALQVFCQSATSDIQNEISTRGHFPIETEIFLGLRVLIKNIKWAISILGTINIPACTVAIHPNLYRIQATVSIAVQVIIAT